jgi:hypothetical protein
MSIFHRFWMDLGTQNHSKISPWTTPTHPRTLPERLLDAPGAKKASQTQFLVVWAPFWMDFGRIWTPKWFPKGFQNIQNLFLGFSCFLLVLQDLCLPASGLQVASAGFAKRKQCARPPAGRQASRPCLWPPHQMLPTNGVSSAVSASPTPPRQRLVSTFLRQKID